MKLSFLASPAGPSYDEPASLRRDWWIFFALGLVSVIVGLLAISSAFVATLASVVVFGVLLLIAGLTEVIHAVMVRNRKGLAPYLLAALYLMIGLFMLRDPVRAAALPTLLLTTGFFVGGLLRINFSLAARLPAWPWVLLNGVVDLILGVIILSGWPASRLWVIGLFVGIDLLFQGWAWVILGLTGRTHNPALSA